MSGYLIAIVVGACLVVLAILLVGIGSFARGGEFHRRYANKIMRLRIAAQFVAVIIILLAVWASRNGW